MEVTVPRRDGDIEVTVQRQDGDIEVTVPRQDSDIEVFVIVMSQNFVISKARSIVFLNRFTQVKKSL